MDTDMDTAILLISTHGHVLEDTFTARSPVVHIQMAPIGEVYFLTDESVAAVDEFIREHMGHIMAEPASAEAHIRNITEIGLDDELFVEFMEEEDYWSAEALMSLMARGIGQTYQYEAQSQIYDKLYRDEGALNSTPFDNRIHLYSYRGELDILETLHRITRYGRHGIALSQLIEYVEGLGFSKIIIIDLSCNTVEGSRRYVRYLRRQYK